MKQTKIQSAIETCTSTAIGYSVAVASQVIIFPWFNIHVPLRTNIWIGIWFTIISLIRSYLVRRLFNWWHHRPFDRTL